MPENITVTNNIMSNAPVVSAPNINQLSKSNERIRKQTVLASNELAPIVLGRDRFFAKPWNAFPKDDFLYIPYLVSWGGPEQTPSFGTASVYGIGGYNAVYIDGIEINSIDGFLKTENVNLGSGIEYYTGTTTQSVSPFLVEALGSEFTNTYSGFAYIVLKVPSGISNGFPRVEVDINGLKVKKQSAFSALEKTEGAASSVNLVPYSSDSTNWGAQNGATIAATGSQVGSFVETTVTSGGLNYAIAKIIPTNTTGVIIYAISIYYKAGTSGRFRIQAYDVTQNSSSIIQGVVGSLPTTGTNTPSVVGVLSLFSDKDFGTYRLARFIFVPATYTNNFQFFTGPSSATSGENVFLYGAQIENITNGFFGVPQFSENPVDINCFLLSEAGEAFNTTSAQAAANWNNELLPQSTKPRRSIGMTLDKVQSMEKTIEYFRAYTGCSILNDAGVSSFLIHEERATSQSFGDDEIKSIKISKEKSKNVPSKIVVTYTDTSDNFSKQEASVVNPDNTIAERISKVEFLGCNDFNFAKREATERFQRADKSDLRATIELFDEGLNILIGDICSITYSNILTNKLMEVVSLSESSAGNWEIKLEEYDPLFFSTELESEPTFPDTLLPIHVAPPQVQNIQAEEEVYKRRNGQYDNRFKVTWDKSTSPYARNYVVRFKIGGVVVGSVSETGLQTSFGPLEEGVEYTIEVVAVTSLFEGAPNSIDETPNGKDLVPPNVTIFDVFEVGGQVRLSWGEVVDLDIIGYEIKFGAVGVTYENATQLNVVESLRYITNEVPEGTYDFLIKAKDSVGQFSPQAKRASSIAVTLDERNLLVGNGIYPARSNLDLLVHRTKEVRCSTYEIIYTKPSSETWSDLFNGAVLPSSGSIASKQTFPSSGFFRHATGYYTLAGTSVSGNFGFVSSVTNYTSGTLEYQFLGTDLSVNFTQYQSSSVQANAKYGYLEYRGTGIVRIDLSQQLYRVNAVTKNETGTFASATGGKTVPLVGKYTKYKNITATPIFSGTAAAAYCVIDAVDFTSDPNTFDVYMFNAAGDELPNKNFIWRFEGV